MSFDMETWEVYTCSASNLRTTDIRKQRAIEVFNIQEPIIPQRPKQQAQMSDGRKWVF